MVGEQYIFIGEQWVGTDNALSLESSETFKLVSGPAETACLEHKMWFQIPPCVRTGVLGWAAHRGRRTPAVSASRRQALTSGLVLVLCAVPVSWYSFLIRNWHINQVEFSASLPALVHSSDSFPPVSLWHWLLLRSMQWTSHSWNAFGFKYKRTQVKWESMLKGIYWLM